MSRARRSLLKVNVGSTNPTKIRAVKEVFSDLFSKEFILKVKGVQVDPGVPGEPWGEDVLNGAKNRARLALGDADYGVGIEAGLIRSFGEVLGVQYCVVVDRKGAFTIGHGPGFRFPPMVLEKIEKGHTVSQAMEDITGIKDIGRKGGAIELLTNGIMDRTELTKIAVTMAMVPRIRKDLY